MALVRKAVKQMTCKKKFNLRNTIRYAIYKSFGWIEFVRANAMIMYQHQELLRYSLVCWVQVLRNSDCLVFTSHIGLLQTNFIRMEANI